MSNPFQVDGSIWARYAQGTAGRDPMPFFDKAVEVTDGANGTGRLVIDVGCGAGNEALAFLDRGWRVHAVDAEPTAVEMLRTRAQAPASERLTTDIGLFHDLELPVADLVFASLSLPFAAGNHDRSVIATRDAVKPGGWFVGVLLGHNDTWATEDDVHTIDREDIRRLFSSFGPVIVDEEEFDGPSSVGQKHWHWYVVSARKPT